SQPVGLRQVLQVHRAYEIHTIAGARRGNVESLREDVSGQRRTDLVGCGHHGQEYDVALPALESPRVATRDLMALQQLGAEFVVESIPGLERLLVTQQGNHADGAASCA